MDVQYVIVSLLNCLFSYYYDSCFTVADDLLNYSKAKSYLPLYPNLGINFHFIFKSNQLSIIYSIINFQSKIYLLKIQIN
jgi:hypothetical protein